MKVTTEQIEKALERAYKRDLTITECAQSIQDLFYHNNSVIAMPEDSLLRLMTRHNKTLMGRISMLKLDVQKKDETIERLVERIATIRKEKVQVVTETKYELNPVNEKLKSDLDDMQIKHRNLIHSFELLKHSRNTKAAAKFDKSVPTKLHWALQFLSSKNKLEEFDIFYKAVKNKYFDDVNLVL